MQLALSQQDRNAEILDRIRPVFAEKGFDGASMQDLARAAGMSAGNFYRYFSSKSAIVEAMIARDLATMQEDFTQIIQDQDPIGALKSVLRARIAMHRANCDGSLWADIHAAASRRPEIARASLAMEETILTSLCAVLAQAFDCPPEAARARFGVKAALVVLLVKASTIFSPKDDALADHLIGEVLRIIEDELTPHSPIRSKVSNA